METKGIIAAPRRPMRRYGGKNCGKVAHQCIRAEAPAFVFKDIKCEVIRKEPAYTLRRKLTYLRNGLSVEEVIRG